MNFYFDLVLPFYFLQWNRYFSTCENLPISTWQFPHVSFESASQFSFIFSINIQWYQTSLLCTFLAQALYTLVKKSSLKCKFFRLSSAQGQNLSNFSCQFWNNKSFLSKFCITLNGENPIKVFQVKRNILCTKGTNQGENFENF